MEYGRNNFSHHRDTFIQYDLLRNGYRWRLVFGYCVTTGYGESESNGIHLAYNGFDLQRSKRNTYRKRWRNLFVEHRSNFNKHHSKPVINDNFLGNRYGWQRLHCVCLTKRNSKSVTGSFNFSGKCDYLQRSKRNTCRKRRSLIFME